MEDFPANHVWLPKGIILTYANYYPYSVIVYHLAIIPNYPESKDLIAN